MVITTRFELSVPVEAAWAYLLDVPKIAHCVPGASLTEVIDDKTYAGKVEVKLGPIGVSYKGQITIESMDEATHTVAIKAAGNETRGRGGAVGHEHRAARAEREGDQCRHEYRSGGERRGGPVRTHRHHAGGR